jgi:hypothetical protein
MFSIVAALAELERDIIVERSVECRRPCDRTRPARVKRTQA